MYDNVSLNYLKLMKKRGIGKQESKLRPKVLLIVYSCYKDLTVIRMKCICQDKSGNIVVCLFLPDIPEFDKGRDIHEFFTR